MPKRQTKAFGVYHWDTFDNETTFLDDFDTYKEAEKFIKNHYGDRIKPNGADKAEIIGLDGNTYGSLPVG